MHARPWWSFALAGIALLAFVAGGILAFSPPSPECGEDLYCKEEAYADLRGVILSLWGVATVLVVGAGALYWWAIKNPAPKPSQKAPAKKRAQAITETADGRRVVSTRHPGERESQQPRR